MAILFTQHNFPRLWLIFQSIFGANRDKRLIALRHLDRHRGVLEIGCSLGIVSHAFTNLPQVSYLGIDIDEQAIDHARRRFSRFQHMSFSTKSLQSIAKEGHKFDYVLFANILHHVDDDCGVDLLKEAIKLINPGGCMLIMEPDILHPHDSLIIRFLYRLERGQFRRSKDHLSSLIERSGAYIGYSETRDISVGILPWAVCGHMLVFEVRFSDNQ